MPLVWRITKIGTSSNSKSLFREVAGFGRVVMIWSNDPTTTKPAVTAEEDDVTCKLFVTAMPVFIALVATRAEPFKACHN